jgi:TolA-binding protein
MNRPMPWRARLRPSRPPCAAKPCPVLSVRFGADGAAPSIQVPTPSAPWYRHWLLLFLLAGLAFAAPRPLPAQTPAPAPAERLAFDAAVRTLQSGFAAQAAGQFDEFARAHPESPLVPEALLLESRARADLGQLDAAAELISRHLDRFGNLRDRALHALGEIHLRREDPAAAAAAFERLLREIPQSPLVPQAGFGQALALFRAGRYAQASELLASPTNAFARAVAGQPDSETAVRGTLLLAECRLRSGEAAQAAATLDGLTHRPLSPPQAWERQFLATSILLTNRQTADALAATTNLLTLATAAASRDLAARSHALRGEVLILAGRPADAFGALTNNLADGTPMVWRRDALLALADLPLTTNLIETAVGLFAPLTAGATHDPAANAARLAVAELRLQQHFAAANVPAPTNHLPQARALVLTVLSNPPAPPLHGRAWYDLGWIELAAGNLPPATEAFSQAAQALPPSALQVLARFKLGDCLSTGTNHALALTNYLVVIRDAPAHPSLRGAVLERALYQGALAALESGNQALASDLAGRAVDRFPDGDFRDDTRVLYGQTLARLDPPGRAREILQRLAQQLGQSPAVPEIQLALARSYLREGSWSNALHQLDEWTRANAAHPGIARAEFERGWAAFKTGDAARAHGLFTNFLARFPEDPAAPRAQMWVGDHQYRLGQFAAAEAGYQLVYQRTNWPVTRLTHEARLMAGRAAFARQGFKDAKPYFRWLIANGPPAVTNSLVPPELVARAYFALGDCFLQEPEGDDKLGDAMTAFATVIDRYPESPEALLARGKLANCHLARADLDPAQASAAFTNAAALYQAVTNAPSADITSRSQAEVGLGLVREKQAAQAGPPDHDRLTQEALAHYLGVFHGRNLRPGEAASPFWLNRAGLEAARLAESLGLRDQAANLYDSLARTFPASAAAFQRRAAQLRER